MQDAMGHATQLLEERQAVQNRIVNQTLSLNSLSQDPSASHRSISGDLRVVANCPCSVENADTASDLWKVGARI